MVGAWNGNSNNSLVNGSGGPLFSIDVTTYVWQGFMEESTKGWEINGLRRPQRPGAHGGRPVDRARVVRRQRGRGAVPAGHDADPPARGLALRRGGADDRRVRGRAPELDGGEPRLAESGRGAARAPVGGPENTATAYFYNPRVQPVRAVVGAAPGRRGLRAAERAPVGVHRPVRLAGGLARPVGRARSRARRRASRPPRPRRRPNRRPRRPPSRPPRSRRRAHAGAVGTRSRSRRPRTQPARPDRAAARGLSTFSGIPAYDPPRPRPVRGPAERAVIDLSRS